MGDSLSTWIQPPPASLLEQGVITPRRQLDVIQLVTIQSLPNELLIHIFRLACTTVRRPPPHTSSPDGSLSIPPPTSRFSETPKLSTRIAIRLCLVSRHWRLLLLSDPTLWSNIDISRRHTGATNFDGVFLWAVICMSRSPLIPMSLSVRDVVEKSTRLTHFITTNDKRIRELRAYLRTQDFRELQSPMPNLEVLEIGLCDGMGLPLLPQLFSRHYPRLKHLSIQHFTTVPLRAFTNLVTLVLSYSIGRVELGDFLALIADSPRLEKLWIKKYKISPWPTPLVPVSLPRLSSITLENCDSHLILNALRIPDTAKLRIMCAIRYLAQQHRNTLMDTFPLDPTIVGPLKRTRVLSYGVDENTAVLFLKDSRGKKVVHVEQGDQGPGQPLVRGRLFGTSFHSMWALNQTANLFTGLTTLELDLQGLPDHEMEGMNLSFWLAFFKSTPLLESLHAFYLTVPPMLDGLNPSNNGRDIPCPFLRTLQLDIRTRASDLKEDWLLQVIDTARWRGKCRSPFRDVFVNLVSSHYGTKFTLPPDAVRAMFTLRAAGVENMVFSNGTTTQQFDKNNFTLPQLPPLSCGYSTTAIAIARPSNAGGQ